MKNIALDWGPGDVTLLIHEGVKAEEEFEKSVKLQEAASEHDGSSPKAIAGDYDELLSSRSYNEHGGLGGVTRDQSPDTAQG
ncbi:hypothetical protein SSX86_008524 [Deinandra increscens subsp. villosa]|uniref:Uncharacterized protein n=1 Tax=Deinandra increscens subsp. villosa TaxID=3103831 RepID=A0AAP0DG97_9ASTR